jgi:hypothetical protein
VTISPKRTTVYSAITQLLESRSTLTGEQQSRFDETLLQSATALQAAAEGRRALANIPIIRPNPVDRKVWKKKKSTLNSRGLTANEIAAAEAR